MARLSTEEISSFPRCMGVLSRLAYQRAKAEGVELEPLIKKARLTREELEDLDAPLSVSSQIKFVGLIADALGDSELGFHIGRECDVREMGLLYYVAASADTLGSALRRLERYSTIGNEGLKLTIDRANSVRVSFHYSGVARNTDMHQVGVHIVALICTLRQLTHQTLHPTTVRLMHSINDKHNLASLLHCEVEDHSEIDQIELPATSWELPVLSSDPYLQRLCEKRCEKALALRDRKSNPLKANVENAAAALLPHGQARLPAIAAKLGMSPRTLARRLSSEGLSFAGILEETRSALADRYLADRALPIKQIAWLLGYTDTGTFTRAFQRWTGMLPSTARARRQGSVGLSGNRGDR